MLAFILIVPGRARGPKFQLALIDPIDLFDNTYAND